MSRNFKSDNVSAVCAPIMAAINAANVGSAPSYGGDEITQALQTAANALALAQIVPPFGAVYCHHTAHVDEFLAAASSLAHG